MKLIRKIAFAIVLLAVPYSISSQTRKHLVTGSVVDAATQKPVSDFNISGIAIDSATRAPVPYLTVCVANTTIGTMTDEKGRFTLKKIPDFASELICSRLDYELKKVNLAALKKQGPKMTIVMQPKVITLSEAVIIGKKDPNWNYYHRIFREFFLGDVSKKECILRNPEALVFKKEGNGVTASAREPLIIDNFLLGYTLNYYLDYFIFQEGSSPKQPGGKSGFYSFKGEAYFREMDTGSQVTDQRRQDNRMNIYQGTLSYFLSRLYAENWSESKFTVIMPMPGLKKLHQPPVQSPNKKVRETEPDPNIIDSAFCYNSSTGIASYLQYRVGNIVPLKDSLENDSLSGKKVMKYADTLLVFRDTRNTPALHDDETSLFYIGKGQLVFDQSGNYQIFNSDLIWGVLDSPKKLIRLLPMDYQPVKLTSDK